MSVFDYFVGLRLKGLTSTIKHLEQVLCKAARDTSNMKYVTKQWIEFVKVPWFCFPIIILIRHQIWRSRATYINFTSCTFWLEKLNMFGLASVLWEINQNSLFTIFNTIAHELIGFYLFCMVKSNTMLLWNEIFWHPCLQNLWKSSLKNC